MRLAWPPPWHLIASALISVLTLVLVNLSPLMSMDLGQTGQILALSLIALIPGYLLALALFPSRTDLSLHRRALLSIIFSAFLAILLGLVLYFTPRGLKPTSLATILSLVALFLVAVSYVRWSELPRRNRFLLKSKGGLRSTGTLVRTPKIKVVGRGIPLLLGILAVGFVATLALTSDMNHGHSNESGFTEFLVSWPKGIESETASMDEGREIAANAKIINHELRSINYTLRMMLNNSVLFNKDIHLRQNETWQGLARGILTGTPGRQKLGFSLFREWNFTNPYKEDHIWINLSRDNLNESDSESPIINSSGFDASENSLVIMEQQSKASASSTSQGGSTGVSKAYAQTTSSGTTADISATSSVSSIEDQAISEASSASPESIISEEPANSVNEVEEIPEETSYSEEYAFAAASEVTNSNLPPAISGLYANKSEPQTSGVSVLWTVDASDSEGDQIFYRFSINNDSPIVWSRFNSWNWDTTGLAPGRYLITAFARDGNHASVDSFDSTINTMFTLMANNIPIVQELKSDKASPQIQGSKVTWTAKAKDQEDQVLYKFLQNNQDATEWSSSNTWSWDTSSAAPGEYKISVLVRDGSHAPEDSFDDCTNATITLIAPNRIPALEELKSDKSSPQDQGTGVTWTARSIDPDGDAIFYKFLLNDEEATGWSSSNTWTLNGFSTVPGDCNIKVLVRDGNHATPDSFDDSKFATFTFLPSNQTPFLKSLLPDKTSPQDPGVQILWIAEANDPNGDQLQYKFLQNDRVMSKWSESNSWKWFTNGLPAGEYRISVQIRDGELDNEDSFDSMQNATFILGSQNEIPVLQELKPDQISPQSPGSIVTWMAKATDLEGDGISYKFMLNDEDMTGWSPSNSWTWNTASANPGEYNVMVLVRDGKHSSEDSFDVSLDESFTLILDENQKPVLHDIEPDASSPQSVGTKITWNAEASDDEGDGIFYKFMLNDKDRTGWSSSNSWIWDTSSANPGEYTVMVLVRDDKHASSDSSDDSKSSSFTIMAANEQNASNKPPIVNILEPDSSSPQVQGATILWNAIASDQDGDEIQYKFMLNDRAVSRWSTENSWKWSTNSELPAGLYRVKVLARDGKHASEDSFDNSLEKSFSITTEIDQQIDQLMKTRRTEAKEVQSYQSTDIQVSNGNASKNSVVLGKSKSTLRDTSRDTPRKLGG